MTYHYKWKLKQMKFIWWLIALYIFWFLKLDKNPYAAPPNMEGNKGPGSYPTQTQFGQPYPTTQAAFPPQPGFAPYGSPNQSMPQDPYLSNTTTDTDPMVKGFDFSTETIRRGFIRKVYSILSLQLLLTVGAILLATHSEGVGSFLNENIWLLIVSFILVFVCLITLSCCEGVRRTSPHNAIFLGLFTIGESICVSYTTLSYDRDIVRSTFIIFDCMTVSININKYWHLCFVNFRFWWRSVWLQSLL